MHKYEIQPQDHQVPNHGVAPNHSYMCHYISVICDVFLVELVLLLNLQALSLKPEVEPLLDQLEHSHLLCTLRALLHHTTIKLGYRQHKSQC